MRAKAFEESTVLELGARGALGGSAFRLTGRACVRSDNGGLWNEWLVRFDGGRTAVLAEAGGRFTLYAERPLAPDFDVVVVGAPLDVGFMVIERGKATRVAVWGDTGATARRYRYADLSAADGRRATIDWSGREPRVYVGEEVPLEELGLRPRTRRPRFLPAPKADRPSRVDLWLELGDEGTIFGGRYRVIGIVHRSLHAEGERFTWEEYVLHSTEHGFRWLVLSDGHWNVAETVDPALVHPAGSGVVYRGRRYRELSAGAARVEWAVGELPWQARIGDQTEVTDYLSRPHVLSRETTEDEITWSLSTYVPSRTIARAFDKRTLPKPLGRAPNQPQKAPRR
jgi:hypothetical protein